MIVPETPGNKTMIYNWDGESQDDAVGRYVFYDDSDSVELAKERIAGIKKNNAEYKKFREENPPIFIE